MFGIGGAAAAERLMRRNGNDQDVEGHLLEEGGALVVITGGSATEWRSKPHSGSAPAVGTPVYRSRGASCRTRPAR